jgi:hypothetical protein
MQDPANGKYDQLLKSKILLVKSFLTLGIVGILG